LRRFVEFIFLLQQRHSDKEESMKRLVTAAFITAIAWFSLAPASATQTATPKRESAVVEFSQNVKVQGVLLRGSYIFVHDEERMARGEPCSWIYRNKNGKEGALVASFHCVHTENAKAKDFTVRLRKNNTPYEVLELLEFQFKGSTAGHRVPGV
jgi:hypothetical protein